MSGRRFLTVTEVCVACGFEVRIRTAVPVGREHHAMSYAQAVAEKACPRCRQRVRIAQCSCTLCVPQPETVEVAS